MTNTAASVFISYSSLDSPLVAPVVALLRASRVIVFRDADSITPGRLWRKEIENAIRESKLIIVFCCDHSYASFEVVYEYRLAMELGKEVLPLRLDGTPVPADLRAYQLIDFRSIIGAQHSAIAPHSESAIEKPVASSDRRLRLPIARAWHRWIRRGDEVVVPVACSTSLPMERECRGSGSTMIGIPSGPLATQAEQQMAQLIEIAVFQRTAINSRRGA